MHPGKDDIDFAYAFQRGEEKGFNYFFKSLYPALLYHAFRIINNKSAAEELVGDSFIKLWNNHSIPTFNQPKVIRSWLYTTVNRACIDWIRKQKQLREHEQNFVASQLDISELPMQHQVIYTEVTLEVYNVIKVLPSQCREVFRLLFIEGKTLKETADEMGLSISTIKNQRARGLKLIKKRMPSLCIFLLFFLLI